MPVRKCAAPGRRNFNGWLWPATALLVLCASCAEPAKQNKTSPSPQASRQAQPAQSAPPAAKPADPAPAATAGQQAKPTQQPKPAPAASKAEPASADASKPSPAARKPSPQSMSPSGSKADEPKTVATASHAKAAEPQPVPPMSDAERNSLADQIRKQAEALKASQASNPPAAQTAGNSPDLTTSNKPGAQKAAPLNKEAAGKDALSTASQTPPAAAPNAQDTAHKGCGPSVSGVDLTPLPLDQPQPKFKANALKFEADAWVGKEAKFVVEVTNEGEGKLAVRLKGG